MPDKNFVSYEALYGQTRQGVNLAPADPRAYNDTMKVFKCTASVFLDFSIVGSREDCVDVGRETCDCIFQGFVLEPKGQYVLTLKGGSNYNRFMDWTIKGHGSDVDIEVGNWHSLNFEPSVRNLFVRINSTDGSPVTYCYRWGCKPEFVDSNVRHLWWRSAGLTVYWWAKYFWHRILKRPDNY